ncbi:MAG: hypothetical protein AB7E29_13040 [Xanthobacter sp.]
MIAIGCLAPLILGAAGALSGNWLAGAEGLLWGGGGGLVAGGMVLSAIAWLMRQIKHSE